jgi:hypothetical protein
MVSIVSLWLPILVSAVAVFFVFFLIHMVLKYHASDFQGLPSEDNLMDAARTLNIPPGDYMMPHCAPGKNPVKDPVYMEKFNKGPVAVMTFMPAGEWNMGRSLTQWFIFCLVVSIFSGFIASMSLGPGQSFVAVTRVAGTAAFMGYALGQAQNSIWYRRKWSTTFKNVFDGLLSGLATGAVFAALWPKG